MCAKASLAYLIGESNRIQASHLGIEAAFTTKPPNKIIGNVKSGAIAVAEVMFEAREEMTRPIPIDVCTMSNMTRYN